MLLVQVILSGVVAGTVYGVLGMGFVMTYKAARVLNLAHGGMAMFLAFVALWFIHDRHWPYGLAMAATALAAIALGLAINFLIMQPLRHRPPLDSTVASLGLLLTLQATAVLIWGPEHRPFPSPLQPGAIRVADLNITYHQLLVFVSVGVVSVLMVALFRWTSTGMAIRAHVENASSARLLGVSPLQVSSVAWCAAALLAAFAGVMLAPLTLLDTTRMPLFSVKALVAALFGRLTSFEAALMGGLVLGVGEAYCIGFVNIPGASDYLPFGLVLLTLLYQGLRRSSRTSVRAA